MLNYVSNITISWNITYDRPLNSHMSGVRPCVDLFLQLQTYYSQTEMNIGEGVRNMRTPKERVGQRRRTGLNEKFP